MAGGESGLSVIIRIPAYLRDKTEGSEIAEVQGSTVRESIESLTDCYPKLRGEILDHQGKLLLKWMVYVNEKGAVSNEGLSWAVEDGDTISLVPLIDGG
jgi:molybdopterin converting factor small subunit